MSLELETAPTDRAPETTPTGIAPPEPSQQGGGVLPPVLADPEAETRQQFVDLALSVVGLGAVPATLEAYLDLLATSTADRASPAMCRALAAMSSCGLTARGLWLRAGIVAPALMAPYRIGYAIVDVIEIARAAGALHGADRMPARGDVVILTSPEHVLTVVDVLGGGSVVQSVDGGERDAAGLECITRRERGYVVGLHGASLGNRPIEHVIDCVALAQTERWLPPQP